MSQIITPQACRDAADLLRQSIGVTQAEAALVLAASEIERLSSELREAKEAAYYAGAMAGLAIRDRNEALLNADRRIADLLEANNRYQQEARDARADVRRMREAVDG